jgi:hypothetical protein
MAFRKPELYRIQKSKVWEPVRPSGSAYGTTGHWSRISTISRFASRQYRTRRSSVLSTTNSRSCWMT